MPPLSDLDKLSHAEKDELIRTLYAHVQSLTSQVTEFTEKVKTLEGRLALNSRNSSKPPSANGPGDKKPPKPVSLREKGKKKSGGQKGHEGKTLNQVATPDHIEKHLPSGVCSCGLPLSEGCKVETRQVFDIPPIKPVVTEHQLFASVCSCGKVHRGQFPADVSAHVQYGAVAKATAVHFTHHEMLPVARTSQLMGNLFELPMSEATVIAIQQEAAHRFSPIVEGIKDALKLAPAIHADETGMYVAGKCKWLHVAATETLTWMGAHDKRGKVAFDDFCILGQAIGVLIHDGLRAYRLFDEAVHGLCNQHHLRELVFVSDEMKQEWARDMIILLRTACHEVNGSPSKTLVAERLAYFQLVYDFLLQAGEAQNPEARKEPGKRGKAKQNKAFNLLARLSEYRDDVWRFAVDPNVPFTNNIAEQAVRMSKVKQKISGGFRTMLGLQNFCIIRSYMATLKKQGISVYDAVVQAFRGSVVAPAFG